MQMNLTSKLASILGLVCISIMSLYSATEIQNSEKTILEDTNRVQAQLLENMAPIIQKNMWDFNRDDLKTSVEGVFKNKEITKFEIFDEKGSSFEGAQRKYNYDSQNGESILPAKTEIPDNDTLENVPKEQVDLQKLQQTMKEKGKYSTLMEDLDSRVKRVGIMLFAPSKDNTDNEEPKPIGYARITYSTHEAATRVKEMRLRGFTWSSSISGSILITALGFIVMEVLRPLKKVNRTSRKLAEGEFTKITGKIPQNEMGTLILNFNKMIDKIELKNRIQTTLIDEAPSFINCRSLLNTFLQIQNSYTFLLQRKLSLQFYVAGDYVANGESTAYYLIEHSGTPRKATGIFDPQKIPNNTHRNYIKSGKDNRIIASIDFSIAEEPLLEEEKWALEKLANSVLGSLTLIKNLKA